MDLTTILQVAGTLAGPIAAYVAIRADLAQMKATIALLQDSTQRAHVRLDDHISRSHTK